MPQNRRTPVRQRVSVVLTLRGTQDTAVVAHHPQTDDATVSVRIGRTLIYFHDWAGAAAVMQGWRGVSHYAGRLPVIGPIDPTSSAPDVMKAATAIDVVGSPRVVGLLRAPAGRPSRLVVTIDRLCLVIHDRKAYVSTRAAFVDAAELAERVLPKPAVPDLRLVAMERAGRALGAPVRASAARRTADSAPTRLAPQASTRGRDLR